MKEFKIVPIRNAPAIDHVESGKALDILEALGYPVTAFLTLEIIPVIVTYWRLEQLLWERLTSLAPPLLRRLKIAAAIIATGASLAAGFGLAGIYVTFPGRSLVAGEILAGIIFLGGVAQYALNRPSARQVVWPAESST